MSGRVRVLLLSTEVIIIESRVCLLQSRLSVLILCRCLFRVVSFKPLRVTTHSRRTRVPPPHRVSNCPKFAGAHLSNSRCPYLTAPMHVSSSHWHPFVCAHCSNSRCPPAAANAHVSAFHGHPFTRNHPTTAWFPSIAACMKVISSHGHPFAAQPLQHLKLSIPRSYSAENFFPLQTTSRMQMLQRA